MLIEHIFYFNIPFSCQISSIHAFVLPTNGLQVDADYIHELSFYLSRFWEQISQPLFNDPLSLRPFFRTPFNGRYRQV